MRARVASHFRGRAQDVALDLPAQGGVGIEQPSGEVRVGHGDADSGTPGFDPASARR